MVENQQLTNIYSDNYHWQSYWNILCVGWLLQEFRYRIN